eukprot:3094675-Pleurochrysis_carterae.AAC.1
MYPTPVNEGRLCARTVVPASLPVFKHLLADQHIWLSLIRSARGLRSKQANGQYGEGPRAEG